MTRGSQTALLLITAFTLSCSTGPSPRGTVSQYRGGDEDSRPLLSEVGCRGIFVDAAYRFPADWQVEASARRQPISQEARELYSACPAKDFTLTECDLPFGQQFCMNGIWTILCRDDAHCPGPMRCTWGAGVGALPAEESYGWCAKSCTSADGPRACGGRGLVCDRDLEVCLPRKTDEFEVTDGPCTGDHPGLRIQLDFDRSDCNVHDDAVAVVIGEASVIQSNPSDAVVPESPAVAGRCPGRSARLCGLPGARRGRHRPRKVRISR